MRPQGLSASFLSDLAKAYATVPALSDYKLSFLARRFNDWRSATREFVRSRLQLPLALYAVAKIVMGDRELLDRIEFRDNLQETDWPLAGFINQVNAMTVFP